MHIVDQNVARNYRYITATEIYQLFFLKRLKKQGFVYLNRNGNFCEGAWILKIIAKAKVDACAALLKQSTGFCRMSVTASLLRLGALLRGNLQMGAFSWHRCMFLLACIEQ